MAIAIRIMCVASMFLVLACDPHDGKHDGPGQWPPAEGEPGEVVEGSHDDDPSVLSPPVVEPAYACGEHVVVSGFVPDADIEIFVDGNPAGGGTSDSPSGQKFGVSDPLEAGQEVTATQTWGGTTSDPSPPVEVKDYREDYPDGPPAPYLSGTPLFECGRQTGARDVVEGAKLDITDEWPSGAGEVVIGSNPSSGAAQAVGVNPHFVLDHLVRARYRICGDESPPSAVEIVQPQPPSIPMPTVDPIYEETDRVVVRNLLNGAFIEVFEAGDLSTPVGSGATSGGGSGQILRIDPPAAAGELYQARQRLCDTGPLSDPVDVIPCDLFPPAKIHQPQAGDDHVHVTEFVNGSRIRIYASGSEVGDGGGSFIYLVRPLYLGEIVEVTQQLGDCMSSLMYRVGTTCLVPEVLSEPTGPHGVGEIEYDLAPVVIGGVSTRRQAVVRYPAVSGGPDADLAASPQRFPLVILLHGNHGTGRDSSGEDFCPDGGGYDPAYTEAPSFRGYYYLMDRLARMGFIAASINANDLNCRSDFIPERAALIAEHLEVWQQVDSGGIALGGGLFVGRVDLDRIGLFGHSRGGEAVVRVPNSAIDPALNIRGVLSLAPTDGYTNSLERVPLLMVLPAADGDVYGNSGARIYDRSRPIGIADWFKAQSYAYGANHNFFNREWYEDDIGAAPDKMTRSEQEALLRGLTAVFFAVILGEHDEYLPVLSGEARLSGADYGRVFRSYQASGQSTIDDYQDSPDNPALNSVDGTVSDNGTGWIVFDEYVFSQGSADSFDNSFYGSTDGLVARWRGSDCSFSSELIDEHRDVSSFDFLALRAGQVYESSWDPLNSPSREMLINIGVSDGSGQTVYVLSNEIAQIPYPYLHPYAPKSMIQSLRVPIRCLSYAAVLEEGELILSDLSAVEVSMEPTAQGTLALDDLEVTP